ncbi:hypothetical protein KW798_03770 [Candidatus Parcubacteria bacterium]|nr:hypothetical protein [Candidatus Parcubacteria bacterium]
MSDVSLNLEYVLLKIYQLFAGVDAGQIPGQTLILIERIAWVGMGVSFLFLIGIVYYRVRLGQVEHEGWHKRAEEEVALTQKRDSRKELNPRWERVIELANARPRLDVDSTADWRHAILEADIMLDELLTAQGYRGETMGEKLKDVNPMQFTTLDLAWQAHKVRNAIAHMGEAYPLTERDTHATIDLYRRVFEEFNYI